MRLVSHVVSVSALGGALVASLLVGPAAAAPAPVADEIPSVSPRDGVRPRPQTVKVDFVMGLPAGSASFVPSDESGEFRLIVRDVPDRVRVTELTTAEESASLPLDAFLAYWTGYGDVTGQFEKRPPRAMVQGTDPDGDLVEVVVWLRDATLKDETVRFDAEVITNPEGLRKVEAKVDDVDQTDVGEHLVVSDPGRLTGVEGFVDMPPKITQPDEETARKTARQAETAQTAMPRTLTCNGVRSSRLTTCWNDITPEQAQSWPGKWVTMLNTDPSNGQGLFYQQFYPAFPGGPADGWIYENVGVVDWGNYYWNPGTAFFSGGSRRLEDDAEGRRTFIRYAKHQTWYGVDKHAVTWFATDRCSWFVARWTPGGSCW